MERTVAVRGPRPADDVWDRYLRPRRWPEWSPQISSVSYPHETLVAGTTGVVHGPLGVRVPFRVLSVESTGPVRGWSWQVNALGVGMRLHHTVEPGTRSTLTIRGLAPAVLLYLPVALLALRRLVR